MTINKNIIISGKQNKPIVIDVYFKTTLKKKPIIVFCHGYKGFKDWGAWDQMAERFAESEYCFVKFNFSHNGGTIDQPIDFPDLEAFGNNNYTKELNDLDSVLTWIHTNYTSNIEFDIAEIHLLGHSRGGGIVSIKAEEDHRIKSVISLASVSDFKSRFVTGQEFADWRNKGVMYIENGRTKQQMPHYFQFFEDFEKNEKQLTIGSAVSNLKIPHLIIHGEKDTSVSPSESYNLHKWNPKSNLKIIKGANHVFNTYHPWDKNELSLQLEEVVILIIHFLNERAN